MIRFAMLPLFVTVVTIGLLGCNKPEPDPPSVDSSATAEPESTPSEEASEASDAAPAEETSDSVSTPAEETSATAEDATGVAANTGTLKLRFQYSEAVEAKPVSLTRDAAFCGKHGLVDEKLVVNAENLGLKNVVVYVYTGRGGSKLETVPPRNETIRYANENCRFNPRIGVVQVGDKILVTNPDPIGHNFNVSFFANDAVNLTVPAGGTAEIVPEKAEPAPIPVACNIHPWMTGYVMVLDHPFVGVSDENGDVTIEGLPVGGPLVFRVFHEAGAVQEVTIDGNPVKWERSRFEQPIEAGLNDMGTVVVPVF